MTKTQDSEGITQRVKKTPLDGEELEFELIDLEKFIADPSPDEFEKLQAIFNRDEKQPESREDFSTDDSASSELPPELQEVPSGGRGNGGSMMNVKRRMHRGGSCALGTLIITHLITRFVRFVSCLMTVPIQLI